MTNLKSDIRLRAAQCLYETWLELGEIQPLLAEDKALANIVSRMRYHCALKFFEITGDRIASVKTIFELSTDAEVQREAEKLALKEWQKEAKS